jgi:filamin
VLQELSIVTQEPDGNKMKEVTEVISNITRLSCNFVAVQRREAGFAELDVTVTSPLGQDLPLEVKSYGNERDCDLIEFCPSLPGNYRFKMTYGGEEISGIL